MSEYCTQRAMDDSADLRDVLVILESHLRNYLGQSESQEILMPNDGEEMRRLTVKVASSLLGLEALPNAEAEWLLKILERAGDVHSFSILYSLFLMEIDSELKIKYLNTIGKALANTQDRMMINLLKMHYETLEDLISRMMKRNEETEILEAAIEAKNRILAKIKEFASRQARG